MISVIEKKNDALLYAQAIMNKSSERERRCYGYAYQEWHGTGHPAVCELRLSDADCSEATKHTSHDDPSQLRAPFRNACPCSTPRPSGVKYPVLQALTLSMRSRRCSPLLLLLLCSRVLVFVTFSAKHPFSFHFFSVWGTWGRSISKLGDYPHIPTNGNGTLEERGAGRWLLRDCSTDLADSST